MSEPIFINHEILFNPTGNEFDECRGELLGSYQLVKIEDYEYKFIKQPQLTIPQSIADELEEELNPLNRESMIETFVLGVNYLVLSDELMKFVITGDNYHIICVYLAGKALGVDLVKVTEE
ncbi:hypothetical protein [Lactococcus lactis]|uniref:hypothetical protein n=1 Tax=Lactococcus lactis TaxID=1358 RepID=UPI0024A8F4E8|nr:hypothetical protein [Lactococcus lactis]